MEITLEQVERLREKAGLSYEQAKALLEETGGSLLDALILLERQGRIPPGGGHSACCSTRPGGEAGPDAGPEQAGAGAAESGLFGLSHTAEEGGAGHFFRDLLRRGLENSLEIRRREEPVTSIPLLIALVLLVLAFWICLPLLVLGLALGYRYRLAGPDFAHNRAGDAVNRAASAVGDRVEQMKDQAKAYFQEHHHGKK